LESLDIVAAESWRRERVQDHVRRFRAGAQDIGVALMPSTSPIQPIMIGAPARAVAISEALEERGLLVTAIRPPTVPLGTSRLRVTLTAAHESQDVDRLLAVLAEVCENAEGDDAR
jgi:8-amino-7-oxononanoate synthase